jgi:formylglycine-generating enzyme required for sulfatase activity
MMTVTMKMAYTGLLFFPALTLAAGAATRKATTFRDCPECPLMVRLPAGKFLMGSLENDYYFPQRRVTIPQPFAVGKFEITTREWTACLEAGGCKHRPGGMGANERPVDSVNWSDAQQYVTWLSLKTDRPYRLLSEAEWEYAARAGTMTPFSTGKCIGPRQAHFNFTHTYDDACPTSGDYSESAVPVGGYAPNRWGLHDMHGNVWEWVQDCYGMSYLGAPVDGSALDVPRCPQRVTRGGSWSDRPIPVYGRMSLDAKRRDTHTGFRVGLTLTPAK